MKTPARVAFVLMGLLSVLAQAQAVDEGVEAKAAFARIKKMEGEWKLVGDGPHDPGTNLKVIYKVTGAGSAVMETQFPGSKHEMVTIYHLDGKDLKMTHYCAAGNQPRMKLDLKGSKPDDLSFLFDGGTNFDPAKDMHIHSMRIKFFDDGKVESEWESYMDGKKSDTTKFPMTRI